jgi:hypothetical protein
MTSQEIMIVFSEDKMKPLKTLGDVPLVILVATVTKPDSGHGGSAVNVGAEFGCIVPYYKALLQRIWEG